MISLGSTRDFSNWLGSLSRHGILLEPDLEPSKIGHLLLGRRYKNVKSKQKLILIRAVTFVTYGSESVHFPCGDYGALPRAQTTADHNFQNSAFLFSKYSQNRDGFNAISDCPFISDLIKFKNKE